MEKTNNTGNTNGRRIEDFIIVLLKYRRIITLNVLIVTIAAVIISLILPNEYTSSASVIPPKKKGGLFGDIAGFSSAIKDISKTLGRLGSTSEEAFNYLVILQSRTASEKMIQKFNLREVYDIDNKKPFEDVIKALGNNVEFNVEDEGNILISVTDKSAIRAARMANYYIEILNKISTDLGVTEARSNREFIEKRFFQLQTDIIAVEDSLKDFSEKYNVMAMDEQMKAAITVAAEIKAQTELAKIERELLKRSFGPDNPMVEQADLRVTELTNRLVEMKIGEDKKLESSLNLFIPFEKIPETGIKYVRLMRDFEIQTRILEFLYPIYEQAKIEEQKSTPVVLVLDKAIPPEKKSSPKRMIIVASAFLLSLFFSIGYVLMKESYSSLKSDQIRYEKIRSGIINPLKFKKG